MATYTETTAEVAVISDDVSNRLRLETITDAAELNDGYSDVVTGFLSEVAVALGEAMDTDGYAMSAESATLNDSVTSSNKSIRTAAESAKLSSGVSTTRTTTVTLAEVAVVLSDAPEPAPYEFIAELAVLGDAVTSVRSTTVLFNERATVSGQVVPTSYALLEEVVVVLDSVTASLAESEALNDSAVLDDAIIGIHTRREVLAEVAVATSRVTATSVYTVIYSETGRVAGEVVPPKSSIGWSAHMANFATTQYVDHPVEQIVGDFGFSRDGVYVRGTEGFAFALQTAQDSFGDLLGKRCTYIGIGCNPQDEFSVDLVAEGASAALEFYPTGAWPRGTARYAREFNAPRGVLSRSFGVRIAGTAPDSLAVSKVELAPLLSARR